MTVVIKIGGSLIPGHVAALCEAIAHARPRERVVLVAGGGDIADIVRAYRRALDLPGTVTCAMAMLSMDQHAHLLAHLGGFPLFRSLDDLSAAAAPVSVFAPALEMMETSLEVMQEVERATSDTVAAIVAGRLGARLLKVTDVDGIYSRDPRCDPDAEFLERVFAGDLRHGTSLDARAAEYIAEHGIETTIINGTRPERLADHLAGLAVRATAILP